MSQISGKVYEGKTIMLCFYDVSIYYPFLYENSDTIRSVIIGNGDTDVPYFYAIDSNDEDVYNGIAFSSKSLDYNLDKTLNAIITYHDGFVEVRQIAICKHYIVTYKEPITYEHFNSRKFLVHMSHTFNKSYEYLDWSFTID